MKRSPSELAKLASPWRIGGLFWHFLAHEGQKIKKAIKSKNDSLLPLM
jgi:hypothetical protein